MGKKTSGWDSKLCSGSSLNGKNQVQRCCNPAKIVNEELGECRYSFISIFFRPETLSRLFQLFIKKYRRENHQRYETLYQAIRIWKEENVFFWFAYSTCVFCWPNRF